MGINASMAPTFFGVAFATITLISGPAQAQNCAGLPDHAQLQAALAAAVDDANAGLGNQMWATVVNRNGKVCAIAFTGDNAGDQWPGSRVISVKKRTLPTLSACRRGRLRRRLVQRQPVRHRLGGRQPPGSAVQQSGRPPRCLQGFGGAVRAGQRPTDQQAYRWGQRVRGRSGPRYDETTIVGGLGVSGDTSCTDHIVAWRVRDALELDNVPGGVSDTGDDNLIIRDPLAPNAFEHPNCGDFGEVQIIEALPANFPIGPNA